MLPAKQKPSLNNLNKLKQVGQACLKALACTSCLLSFSFLASHLSWAQSTSLSQTQTQLKQLDQKINQLKSHLSSANDKRGLLNKELAVTEKQIGSAISKLHLLRQNRRLKLQKIAQVQENIQKLNKQLIVQQKLLAEHVRARYKMGEYQPIKWLLNQDDPSVLSRLLTFYQYFVQSRQKLIAEIDATKQKLKLDQVTLKKELDEQQHLEQQLQRYQQNLEKNKLYHNALIQRLNTEIQSKQQRLAEYQHNKENLARLVKTLASQSYTQNVQIQNKPFPQMRRKLPHPVQTSKKDLQKMNQGLTFFAGEGTLVSAVHPGRVVFSNWLNGYGLLLILDHGQGFMTLYAHNQSLFKRKGETVLQGEQIAAVGHSGGLKQNGLYFEVRHRGKAIPPLDWLS